MASKSSQPALYEKMRSRMGGAPAISPKIDLHPAAAPAAPSDSGGNWLSPGRSIRMPTGYLLMACGLAVLLLSLAYVFGHKRGYSIARAHFDRQVMDRAAAGITDPLTNLEPVLNGPGGRPANGSSQLTSGGSSTTGPALGNSPASWGPLMPAKDPRQKGLNYFIIAETNEAGARQLAEFCRSQGLETYVVAGKNDRFRRVVAFPGFAGRDIDSPQVKALRSQIERIGDNWKENHKGESNLRDAYASLYNG